ncbi:hypothetical protein [Methanobacterium sp. MBAC-LM]|uniref:hypothetical protein n=1 Tax=Methanobacterium sp. MBAC-LM TaxID=3412034 RepID=UPI003C711487
MNNGCKPDKLKGRGCGCSSSLNIGKASSVNTVTCKKCGRTFRTNRKIDICFECEFKN